jgi:hypothetical protein
MAERRVERAEAFQITKKVSVIFTPCQLLFSHLGAFFEMVSSRKLSERKDLGWRLLA